MFCFCFVYVFLSSFVTVSDHQKQAVSVSVSFCLGLPSYCCISAATLLYCNCVYFLSVTLITLLRHPLLVCAFKIQGTYMASGCSSSSPNWVMENGDVPHVLAVDDNLIDRKLVEKLLRNSSCKVTTAENGSRALEFLGSGSKVNLVITDYCMPGMTGYELLMKIKESSMMKELPVVIMSSENIPTRINKCLEGGAETFILKPLKQSDVNKLTCQLMNCRG